MNEKMKTILYVSVAGLMFLLAALMPLRFRTSGQPGPDQPSMGVRSRIFAAYWTGDAACTAEPIAEPQKEMQKRCNAEMEQITERCIIDKRLIDRQPLGSEYLRLETKEGAVNLCRMWLERQGDWRNWLDVCFDADSGEVYYLYLSCECVSNSKQYVTAAKKVPDTSSIAAAVSEESGWPQLYLAWSGDPAQPGKAIFGADGGVCMDLSCIYYAGTLIDIKLCCCIPETLA